MKWDLGGYNGLAKMGGGVGEGKANVAVCGVAPKEGKAWRCAGGA